MEKKLLKYPKICWQYSIKIKQASEELDVSQINIHVTPEIREIDIKKAKEFILKYEWLGNIGSPNYYFGLFFENHLAAVVCYSNTVGSNAYSKMLGVQNSQILQLSRGANTHWAPSWVSSKLISHSIKFLKKKFNVAAIVAYADPEAGEVGYIYQACSFLYLGLTNPGGAKKYLINGLYYHPRTVFRKFGSRKTSVLKEIDPNYLSFPIHSKHRYISIVGNSIKRKQLINKIQNQIQPYPKKS